MLVFQKQKVNRDTTGNQAARPFQKERVNAKAQIISWKQIRKVLALFFRSTSVNWNKGSMSWLLCVSLSRLGQQVLGSPSCLRITQSIFIFLRVVPRHHLVCVVLSLDTALIVPVLCIQEAQKCVGFFLCGFFFSAVVMVHFFFM